MKVRIFFISLLIYFPFVFFAQQVQDQELKTVGYKMLFVRNSISSNWFIQVGAGAQTLLGDNAGKTNLSNRITLVPAVSVGKWFNPYWGLRLKGQGSALKGGGNEFSVNYINAHLDALWNLSNSWGIYSPEKSFHIAPYAGLGYAHRFSKNNLSSSQADYYQQPSDALSVNGGCQFGFRLSKRVNLDFDLGIAIVPDYFNSFISQSQNDIIASVTGCLSVGLGKITFEPVIPFDNELVHDLNDKINKLRTDNDQLSKRPESCPESPSIIPTITNEINYVPNVVFFRLNSSKVDKNQQISVFNTAEFMKSNGGKIKVVGYADKATGTSNYNLILSKKRAKAVAKHLISKYNIPSHKIVIEWKGSGEQPYAENNWNRVVIMSIE